MRKLTRITLTALAATALIATGCDDGGDAGTTDTGADVPTSDTPTGGGESDAGPGPDGGSDTVADPCEGVDCADAPAAECDGNTLVEFTAPGTCADGTCEFDETETDCTASDQVCSDGACVDPCAADPCAAASKDSECDGDTLLTYDGTFTCVYDADAANGFSCTPPAATETDCSAEGDGFICASGQCIEGKGEGECEFSDYASFLSELSLSGGDDCAFDLDDDGEIDNGLGGLLGQLGSLLGDTDIDGLIAEQLEAGTIAILFEEIIESGEADFSGDVADITFNGYFGVDTDDDFNNNLTGEGTFLVDEASYIEGTCQPLISFENATLTGGVFEAGPSLFALSLPLFEGITIDVDVIGTQIYAENTTLNSAGSGLDMPAGSKLGGVVPMDQIYGALNAYVASDCACLGLGDEPLIEYLGEGTKASCASVQAGCGEEDGFCGEIGSFCGLAVGLIKPDIDSDDTGIEDGISLGVCFAANGAIIDGIDPGDEGM